MLGSMCPKRKMSKVCSLQYYQDNICVGVVTFVTAVLFVYSAFGTNTYQTILKFFWIYSSVAVLVAA